jgi:hypothetical protein
VNWADQSIIGVTSVFTPALVNDLRFQYNYWNNHNFQSVPSDCSLPCVAGSLPNVFIFVGSNFPAVGPNFNAPQARNTRRFELIESLIWQKGSHRLKFGVLAGVYPEHLHPHLWRRHHCGRLPDSAYRAAFRRGRPEFARAEHWQQHL